MTVRTAGHAPAVLAAVWHNRWFRRALVASCLLFAVLALAVIWAYVAISLPAAPEGAQTTVVLDADGNVLAELFDTENRIDVPLSEVAPVMIDAVVAAEDRDFYDHGGLDPIGIGRAVIANVRGRPLQGGSTITQQLVKNTWLTPERSIVRKAKEAILAIKVEQQWSKDEILERYLNTVYFGRGAYGIEKAAEIWFGVGASELSLPQAALLAGLIRAPESADPARDPEAATRRREIVLDAMVRTRAITRQDADAAKSSRIDAHPKANPDDQLRGSSAYFVAQVRRWLVDRYGEQTAFGGGLVVKTTLRPSMQAAAERAVFETLDQPDDPDAALVSIDDRGAVLAMIGGRDFRASNVNLALGARGGGQGRQPGSTFKPFVLAAALEDGIPVGQRYPGPARMTVDVDGIEYPVENYEGQGFGTLDLIEATAKSVNTIYVQLIADVGPRKVAALAESLGVSAPIEPHPSIALGAEEVSPLDMATAFMTFGTGGERVRPFLVEQVVDSHGSVIFNADGAREPVYPRRYANVVNHVLQQVIERGTGRAADIGRDAAGKTGTTSANTDAWFVGYTPRVSTAVWMGYKDGTERKMTAVHGRAVTGGSFPAQIWGRFMREALEDIDTGEFEEPDRDLLRASRSGSSSVTTPSESTTPSTTSSTSSSTPTTSTPDDSGSTSSTTSPTDGSESSTSTSTTADPEPSSTTTSAAPATTTTSTPPSEGD